MLGNSSRQFELTTPMLKLSAPSGLSNQNEEFLNTQNKMSTAYSSAMKALQDRVKQLEKDSTYKKAKSTEIELERVNARFQELQMELQIEHNKMKQIIQENEKLNQDNSYLQKQIQQLEKEKERHLGQNIEEKTLWQREKEDLFKKIEEDEKKYKKINENFESLQKLLEKAKLEANKMRSDAEFYKNKNKKILVQYESELQSMNAVNYFI